MASCSHLEIMGRTSPAWDPRRRNRNLGTARAGHGKNNMHVVPHPRWHGDRFFSDMLNNPVRLSRAICGREVAFFVEAPIAGFYHHCTVEDITRLLSVLPPIDWDGLRIIVLRQPTRRQNLLRPVWGRLRYSMRAYGLEGVAIHLDSQDPTVQILWSTSLDPEGQREIRRLAEIGHRITRRGGLWIIQPSMTSIRRQQLFRTVLHEIGHLVDWRRWSNLDRCFQRSWHEQETFAFRYATTLSNDLRRRHLIPFDGLRDERAMLVDGLNPTWFASEATSNRPRSFYQR